jgi:phosphoribosylformylglycinamidine cyclo-ligase
MTSPSSAGAPITYAGAGVDVEAGDRAVELMKEWVARTRTPEVYGGLGGFAGLFDVSALKDYRRPLLATSTDGVGTKVAVAQAMDVHDTIGYDLVGMVVDDIVVCGARPLFMTDYIATGKVEPARVAAIVKGIAQACVEAGCALTGGETAEHPGLLGEHEYDLAGAVTGVVDADDLLGPQRVRAGDAVIAIASSGLHSNGYSLVRRVFSSAGWDYAREVPEFGRSLGEELLEPTKVYAADLLDLVGAGRAEGGVDTHAMSHITGGGLAANLARVLPRGLTALVDRSSWTPPAVFEVVQRLGRVPAADLERTLNQGVGMVALVAADSADAAVRRLASRGLDAWVAGEVREDSAAAAAVQAAEAHDITQGAKGVDGGRVVLTGRHAR